MQDLEEEAGRRELGDKSLNGESPTVKRNKSWWKVKSRGINNLKPIKDTLSYHEYTLQEYEINITDYDIEAINSLLGDIRRFGAVFERQLSKVVHYYITALVKLAKEKQGLQVEWDMEGCRDFEEYVELARHRCETIEQVKKEVESGTKHKRADDEKPDFRGIDSEMLQFEAHSPSGLET